MWSELKSHFNIWCIQWNDQLRCLNQADASFHWHKVWNGGHSQSEEICLVTVMYFSLDKLPNTAAKGRSISSFSVGLFDLTFLSDQICQLLLWTGTSSSCWGRHPHISRDHSDNWEEACGAVAGWFGQIKGEPLLCCSTSVPDPEERVWLPSHL